MWCQSQAEEIGALNETLGRREALLQTLLDTSRLSGTEHAALQHIVSAGLGLFPVSGAATAVYEGTSAGLRVRALASAGDGGHFNDCAAPMDRFVDLVLQQNRTACLNDASLRPDLALAAFEGQPAFRAALCAPIHFASETFGVFTVYSSVEH